MPELAMLDVELNGRSYSKHLALTSTDGIQYALKRDKVRYLKRKSVSDISVEP